MSFSEEHSRVFATAFKTQYQFPGPSNRIQKVFGASPTNKFILSIAPAVRKTASTVTQGIAAFAPSVSNISIFIPDITQGVAENNDVQPLYSPTVTEGDQNPLAESNNTKVSEKTSVPPTSDTKVAGAQKLLFAPKRLAYRKFSVSLELVVRKRLVLREPIAFKKPVAVEKFSTVVRHPATIIRKPFVVKEPFTLDRFFTLEQFSTITRHPATLIRKPFAVKEPFTLEQVDIIEQVDTVIRKLFAVRKLFTLEQFDTVTKKPVATEESATVIKKPVAVDVSHPLCARCNAMVSQPKDGPRQTKAVQSPGLEGWRLGECLGKGAFGAVYKSMSWTTGEAVAIKQIKIRDLPKNKQTGLPESHDVESEIRLLKNLHHPNIVKYLGSVKTPDNLNIILEYCENGSLHSIIKNYGKIPENLAGIWMGEVLLGVVYLHEQGIIHRDIKGANILTTKDGKIKLADFGVSTALTGADQENEVVGTPYWMAPEVIQLTTVTISCDVWSVGATLVELVTGNPPYYRLDPMQAMFAIVEDDHPPLPESVSLACRDFLLQCFQKDPNLRISARKLLKHGWITGSRRSDAPVAKPKANFKEAVEEVKLWNEALKSPDGVKTFRASKLSSSIPSPLAPKRDPPLRKVHENEAPKPAFATPTKVPLFPSKPKGLAEPSHSAESDDNWDSDFASAISPSALHLPRFKPQDNFGGKLSSDHLKSFASFDQSSNENAFGNNNSFGESATIRGPRKALEAKNSFEPETIRAYKVKPTVVTQNLKPSKVLKEAPRKISSSVPPRPKSPVKSQAENKFVYPARPTKMFRESSVDDYSELIVDNDKAFDRRFGNIKNDGLSPLSPRLFHPSDLSSISHSVKSPLVINGSTPKEHGSRKDDPAMRRTRSSVEIQRFAEVEADNDFSDLVVKENTISERGESDQDSEDGMGTLMLSNMSWAGDEDDSEDDVFASLEQGLDDLDLHANIARDKHARLSSSVETIIKSLTTEDTEIRANLAAQLLDVLIESPEVKSIIISAHGMLPILEILGECDTKSNQDMIWRLLKVINIVILDDTALIGNLCNVGGIPTMTTFANKKFSNGIRLEAAFFVEQMYQTSTTLQMFITAGGHNTLADLLDEDFDDARDLVLVGVIGISNVFELQGPTPKNDFCRIFSRSRILSPLALILDRVISDDDELSKTLEGKIVNIFYIFSQAENYVKELVVEDRLVLKRVLKGLGQMTPVHQITMLKFIKNISMLSTTLDSLHAANAIEILIDLLKANIRLRNSHFREICNHVLNTLFNLCRLSKGRQEDAALNGIIPLLQEIMTTDRPPKEFALPILCDMAHSGKLSRKLLWRHQGIEFYTTLLEDQYWQATALNAIFIWLQEETARVEHALLEGPFVQAIVKTFNTPKPGSFDIDLLDPCHNLLRLSSPVAAAMARTELWTGIYNKLNHKKPIVRVNLLRIVRDICDAVDLTSNNIRRHKLFAAIENLAEHEPSPVARSLAHDIIKRTMAKEGQEPLNIGRSRRVSSIPRPNRTPSGEHKSRLPTPRKLMGTPSRKRDS
ncbi:Protein kinase-like (PK-like) [Glarea lozoyensis ATCC 20868]|uniref:non-specific serine/threonine protein kinase n=1 Tax=Glarea lozoyensis (strain ATCC 20868 / MF5171) TaxID=1116229 RepID=S3ECD9_GLAL2|nr:Protein kinase-like (PK-like) [Glarea lozoyensis ATCC 20868]EPE35978.1 Protein kinase-like (PK-like) [Glarea lozoyensis ATCC 20868]